MSIVEVDWKEETLTEYIDTGRVAMSNHADVIVIGLGAMGSAAAQQLAERGSRVLAFDQFTPPHAHGSSHGLSRIFRQAYFEDFRYVPLLVRSYELWQKLERDSGVRLLHLTGGLVIGPEGGELVRRSEESAVHFNLPHQILRADEIKERYPVIAARPDTLALLEQNAGYLVPETCVQQQMHQAAHAGAHLRCNEPVLEWKAEQHGGVSVRTPLGTYSAERLVITVGPWAPRVLADLGLPLQVTRQVLCWFEPIDGLDAFRQEHLPLYLFEAEDEQPLLYGFPLTGSDSEGVKVALHGSDEFCTPETVCREIRPADESAMRRRLATTLPGLAGRMVHAETCLYTMTPDENFIISAHPDHPAVTLAAGFSGHGFKFAPVIGEVLADLATSGRPSFDLSLFSIERFAAPQPA